MLIILDKLSMLQGFKCRASYEGPDQYVNGIINQPFNWLLNI